MKRTVLSLGVAAILALAGTFTFDALRGSDQTAAVAAKGYKTCKAKLPTGKTKTWRCGTDQACCVNSSMNLYVCGYPGLGCL
jgi:hypothetical protein